MSRRRPNSVTPCTPPEPAAIAVDSGVSVIRTTTASSLADTARETPAIVGESHTGSEAATSSLEAAAARATDDSVRAPRRSCRIPASELVFTAETSDPGPSACRQPDACSELSAAAQQPPAVLELLMLVERFKLVFLSGEGGPVATADGGVRQQATFELVLAVRDAVNALWTAHETEIKRVCTPFMPQGLIAKQEVFGFALADALGRPILPGDKAMKVGQNGDNAVRSAEDAKDRQGKVVAAREAARGAVRKAQRAAAKDAALEPGIAVAEAAGSAAVAAVLATPVDLGLPNETVGAKRKRPVAAAPTAAAVVDNGPSLANLRQAVRAAQAAVKAAEEAHSVDESRVSRAQRQLDTLGPEPEWSTEFYGGESTSDIEAEDLEGIREECDAIEARMEARYAAAIAPFERARDRVSLASDEALNSQWALREAEGARRVAERALRAAEAKAAHQACYDAEDRMHEHLQWFMGECKRLHAENCELRERCDNLERMREIQEAERMGDLSAYEELSESEAELEWPQWDAQTVARAEEEMRRTTGAAGVRHVM